MKEYTIQPSNGGPAYTFTAELLANVTSKRHNSYIWTEIDLYLTEGGRKIAVESSISTFEDRQDRIKVMVFEDDEEMFRKLGYTKLARRIYRNIGLDEIKVI